MTSIRDIGEDQLIERLLAQIAETQPAGAGGPGDDCAVVDHGGDCLQLLKTDAIVSGIHFLDTEDGERVGWKAAARVISDFAAMGGQPDRFLVTLAVPATTRVDWLEALYRGIGKCLTRHGGQLVGGETSSTPDSSATVISIAATGSVQREHLVLRSSAQPGQSLLCTGTLGGSLDGKHLDFQPRLDAAHWLVSHFKPSAMMDLSDGLAKDLPRLAAASNCGFEIDAGSLPLTAGCDTRRALGDGEDYELLMAMETAQVAPLLNAWPTAFPDLPLTVIGRTCDAGQGDRLDGGWDHFKAR